MLGQIRKFLNTRAARLFFIVLIIPFVMWGVADVARNIGQDTAIATVGDRKIEAPEFQEAFRQQIAQVSRRLGSDPTPEIRRAVAAETLDRLVTQAAIAEEVRHLKIAAPDEAVRQSVFDIPAFRGPNGVFNRQQFEGLLRQNNLTEGRFLDLMRSDLGQRQLMEAVQAGVAAPDVLLKQVFAFQYEARVAETVELPLSAVPEPPPPSEAELKTTYEDDPSHYSAPAYRRIQAVILSPETIAKDIEVPDADVAAYYAAHQAEFGAPEKRSMEVVVAQDEAAAAALATEWTKGADWAEIQKAAAAANASAAALDDVAKTDIPGVELADAAFEAAPNAVTGPIKSAFGYQVVRVTKVTPGSERGLEAAQADIRAKIARERAVDQVYARANKLEDALSAGTALNDLPADLGLAPLLGTLDAQGLAKDGEPAPIPGTPALRQAFITAAFSTAKDAQPQMVEGPDQSYFALSVLDETPPQVKPFEAVEDQVRDDTVHAIRRHEQEAVAAKLMAAVNAGGTLDDAATVAGLRTEKTPPLTRGAAPPDVPKALVDAVFALEPNKATMIEMPDGFIVARLDSVTAPEPSSDPIGAAQMRSALNQALQQDVELTYAGALRDRAHAQVNRTQLDAMTQ